MPELTTPTRLCRSDGSGRLEASAVGWSRRPLHRCDLKGAWGRKKRWNYWAFTTPTHLFSVTVSNLDYAGLAFVYVADFAAAAVCEETVVVPLARGCALPETVGEDVHFERGGLRVEMLHDDAADGHRVNLSVRMESFGGRGLVADMHVLYPPRHDTLNVVVPWSERRFQFTAKHNALPVSGRVQLGAGVGASPEEILFAGPQAFGCLDFGRGIWPYRCAWNWGAASGVEGDHVVGLNLGGQWTDGTGATENAVCVDGRLTKVDADLVWEYDSKDWMKPWRIYDPERRAIDLDFTPVLERAAATRALVVRSEVHQMFGHYRGRVVGADGQFVELRDLLGWAEDHHARW